MTLKVVPLPILLDIRLFDIKKVSTAIQKKKLFKSFSQLSILLKYD